MGSVQFVHAIIIDNKDPEARGRVRVRYEWKGEVAGLQPSDWAPIACNLQHKGAGDWHLPDFLDEVLVSFEQGDSTKPIILGSLLPKSGKPPSSGRKGDGNKDGKNSLRFTRTNGAHLIAFDDTKGDRTIQVIDGEGHEFLICTDKHLITFRDKTGNILELLGKKKRVTLKSSQGHVITMTEKTIEILDAKGQTIILGDGFVMVKDCHGNQVLFDSKGMAVKSSKKVAVEADSKISFAGKTKVFLGSGAATALLKGKTFMDIFNNHTHLPASEKTVMIIPEAMLSSKIKTL